MGLGGIQDDPGIMSKSELQDQLMKLTGDNVCYNIFSLKRLSTQ